MNRRILLPQDIAEPGKQWLEERGYVLKRGRGTDAETLAEDIKGCAAVIARLGNFNESVLKSEAGLRVIARHGAGYDNIDIETAKRLGICVSYDPMSNGNAVAEHVMALIMGCAKNLVQMDAETRRGNFSRRNERLSVEVSGKTLGIVGYGRIGRLTAKKAAYGLGMKIAVYDPYVKDPEPMQELYMADTLEALLRNSDFVSIHMPLTEETRGLMDRSRFAAMKKSAYFINAARGELVDEAALLQALEAERIAGAALDVFGKEPPDMDNPLLSSGKVILSPHNAALTKEAMDSMSMTAARAVDAVLTGKRPEYCVVERPVYGLGR